MMDKNSPPKAQVTSEYDNIAYISWVLAHKKLIFSFPNALETAFIKKRATESQDFIKTGRYLLILLFLFITAHALFYYQDIILKDNYKIIKQIYIPLSITITFILFSPNIRYICQYFYHFMAPCATFILCNIIFLALKYDNDYGNFVIYHLMMAIVLMAFGLRFVLAIFIMVLCSAGMLTLAVAELNHVSVNYIKFSNYYVLYSCVVVALTAIGEWHERLAFLQELLLDHHTQELNTLNKELERIAHEDALTGIANRRSFDELSHKEWDRALRDKHPMSLLMIDVDYFKKFNDHYGHSAGDDCLHLVGQTLQKSVLRSSDIVARYGGEEFVILLPNTKAAGGIEVATRIIEAVDALKISHQQSNTSAYVSISVGVSTVIASSQLNFASLMTQADEALYQAKEQGRHQYIIYEDINKTPPKPSALV